jgi:hypothetical protein
MNFLAYYLVLSLQTDKIIPTPKNLMDIDLVDEMEQRLNRSMEKFGLTRLELFRNIAVKCENFIVFVREISFGSDQKNWQRVCGEIFQTLPILTPFGTCFTTMIPVRFVFELKFCLLYIDSIIPWTQTTK